MHLNDGVAIKSHPDAMEKMVGSDDDDDIFYRLNVEWQVTIALHCFTFHWLLMCMHNT